MGYIQEMIYKDGKPKWNYLTARLKGIFKPTKNPLRAFFTL